MGLKLSRAILALIHLIPAVAVIQPSLLTSLYGIDAQSPFYVLMWHRAALFAMAVLICTWAIFAPEVRALAAVAIAISMGGFLTLFLINGSPESLRMIPLTDVAGLPFLAFVGWSAFRA